MQIDASRTSPNHSRRTKPISCFVLHATAGGLQSSINWLCNPAAQVSSHYVIGKSGTIYQLVPDSEVAWHAGVSAWRGQTNVNEFSIGCELENANTGRDPYPPAQLDALAQLCREKIAQYAIPPENVVRHLDVAVPRGRKSDPAGFDWAGFRVRVFDHAEPSAPYRAISAAWVRSSPTGGAHIGDLVAGQEVQVAAIVPGDLLVRPAGISNQWAKLAGNDHRYVWAKSLREA